MKDDQLPADIQADIQRAGTGLSPEGFTGAFQSDIPPLPEGDFFSDPTLGEKAVVFLVVSMAHWPVEQLEVLLVLLLAEQ